MNITTITVSYGETVGLPEYSNVKPQMTLSATIGHDDDPAAIEAALWAHVRASVQAQADATLEQHDRPAKYSTEPRYQVLRTYWNQWDHRGETKPPQYVIIAPDEMKLDRGAYSQRLIADSSKLRLGHAQKVAAALLGDKDEGYSLLDCSDGDLSRLEAVLPPKPAEEQPAQQHPIDAAPADWEPEADFDEDEGGDDDDDDDE